MEVEVDVAISTAMQRSRLGRLVGRVVEAQRQSGQRWAFQIWVSWVEISRKRESALHRALAIFALVPGNTAATPPRTPNETGVVGVDLGLGLGIDFDVGIPLTPTAASAANVHGAKTSLVLAKQNQRSKFGVGVGFGSGVGSGVGNGFGNGHGNGSSLHHFADRHVSGAFYKWAGTVFTCKREFQLGCQRLFAFANAHMWRKVAVKFVHWRAHVLAARHIRLYRAGVALANKTKRLRYLGTLTKLGTLHGVRFSLLQHFTAWR